MRIGDVVGPVTLNRCHPSFVGARLRMVVPLSLSELTTTGPRAAESIVVWDELGAGLGDRIAISEGPEAAQPFRPQVKAVDAYAAAILDQIHIATQKS
ncbi:MAG: EutN/CcmL family microcompartment protein [Planctomycetota bacterium]